MTECFDNTESVIDRINCGITSGEKNIILHLEGSRNAEVVIKLLSERPPVGIKHIISTHLDRHSFLYTPSMKPYSIDTMLKYSLTEHLILEDAVKECSDGKNYITEFERSLTQDTLLLIDGYDIASPSPYLRHLFTVGCFILVITDKRMEGIGDGILYLECNSVPSSLPTFDLLDGGHKELLITLCAFLSHLDSSAKIVSSRKNIFDAEAIRFYLGDMADGLSKLADLGFIKIYGNGTIHVDMDIQRYVLSHLSPNAESCPTFMEFCTNTVDFSISHAYKDINAVLHVDGDRYTPVAASGELLCLYSGFLQSDPDGILRLYNLLMSYVLENLSMQNGKSFSHHLLMKNAPYFVSVLSENIYDYCDRIYADPDTDEIPSDMFACLDIIRICVCFMRNMTPDIYKRSRAVFDCLQQAFDKLLHFCGNTDFEADDRLLVLDNALEICHETFAFFSATDSSGIFNTHRADFENRRVSYVCERYTDTLFGDSLIFGYNLQTVLLYGKYCRLLEMWLTLHNVSAANDVPLLKQFDCDKRARRENLCNMIKSHYRQISRGLDTYTDVLNERYFTDDIYSYAGSDEFEKRLNDNIHLSKRGYDRATLSGAERHCESVISELKQSESPLETILPVLSPGYPVSPDFYGILWEKDILSMLFDSRNATNRSIEILLESLVFMYPDCFDKEGLCPFYRKLIDGLLEKVSQSRSFLERMYIYTCRMYVKCSIKGTLSEFEDRLYEYICKGSGILPTYCDAYLANAVFCKRNMQKPPYSKQKIMKAISIYEKENPDFPKCGKTLTKHIYG